jgi:hypothetical protein
LLPRVIARLTRRANQVQIDIIEKTIEPAPRDRQRVFICGDEICQAGFGLPKAICRIFIKFDMSGKSPA